MIQSYEDVLFHDTLSLCRNFLRPYLKRIVSILIINASTFERSFFDSLIFDEPQWYRLEIKLQRVEILSLVARSCDKRSKRFATLSDWKSVSHSSVIDACKVVRCKGWIIRLVNIIKIEWSTATNLGTFLLSLNTRDRFSHVLFDNQRSLVVDLYF